MSTESQERSTGEPHKSGIGQSPGSHDLIV